MQKFSPGRSTDFILLMLVLLTFGCNSYDNSSNLRVSQAELKDFWVNDALAFIATTEDAVPHDILKTEIADGSAVAKMFFDSQRKIYKITFVDDFQLEHHYYLENGLLSFSRHIATGLDNQFDWLLAYAQHLPYSAAKKEKDGTLSEADPKKLPWRKTYVAEVFALVQRYQMHEKQTAMVRLHSADTIISGEISPNTNIRYTLNANKGEKLHIELLSATPNVFFMLKPMPGADMVRKTWNGEAQRTGDLYITVFSIRDDKPESFELRIAQDGEYAKR